MVAEQERVGHDDGPDSCYTMEAQVGIPQQECRQLVAQGPPPKEDVTISLLTMMRQAAEKQRKEEVQ